jgi:hypothetical protein
VRGRWAVVAVIAVLFELVAPPTAVGAGAEAAAIPRPPRIPIRIPLPRIKPPPLPLTLATAKPVLSARQQLVQTIGHSRRRAREALRDLYARGDDYDKAIVQAFCTGMEHIHEQIAERPPGTPVPMTGWRAFFIDQLEYWRDYIVGYWTPEAIGRVDAWLNAWRMARITPNGALFYLRVCGR